MTFISRRLLTTPSSQLWRNTFWCVLLCPTVYNSYRAPWLNPVVVITGLRVGSCCAVLRGSLLTAYKQVRCHLSNKELLTYLLTYLLTSQVPRPRAWRWVWTRWWQVSYVALIPWYSRRHSNVDACPLSTSRRTISSPSLSSESLNLSISTPRNIWSHTPYSKVGFTLP